MEPQAQYRDDGHAGAEIAAETVLDPVRGQIDIAIPIVPHPEVVIESVHVEGGARFGADRIRSLIALAPGQRYSATAFVASRAALEATGAFATIAFATDLIPGRPDRIRVSVEVTER